MVFQLNFTALTRRFFVGGAIAHHDLTSSQISTILKAVYQTRRKMNCPNCITLMMVKNGKTPNGRQKYRCPECGKQAVEPGVKPAAKIGRPPVLGVVCKVCGKPATYKTEKLCKYHYNSLNYPDQLKERVAKNNERLRRLRQNKD